MRKVCFFNITLMITLVAVFSGCLSDNVPQDWSETVTLYVSNETGKYTPFEYPSTGKEIEGMKIRENQNEEWAVVHFETIVGFVYERGYSYTLTVKKTHFARPMADASDITYKLLKLISKN